MTASLVYHGRTAILKTPYVREFVERLKAVVPQTYREWEPTNKVWLIRRPYDRVVARELRYYFLDASIEDQPLDEPNVPKPHACSCDADHRALYVCQGAPAQVVRAAYKALAMVNHPDQGGDTETMQRLNMSYERLEAGVSS